LFLILGRALRILALDTIFALSSGAPPAGIAVIRFSGPLARFAFETMAGGASQPGQLVLRNILTPVSGELIDRALVAWFPGPRSFTGEDSGEFHVHGGVAVVSAVFDGLAKLAGFRPAEPGEFARRAFANGKLDLTELEGLADLIAAETEAQRRLAVSQAGGNLRRRLETWRERIIGLRAHAEAAFDFSDEADVPPDVDRDAVLRAGEIAAEIDLFLSDSHRGEIVRQGFEVLLMGPPNSGKSSLLNALAMREVAIVSPEPGTTRDLIEVALDLGGNKVVLVDSAGLREGVGAVEREGIRRAMRRADNADLAVWMVPVGEGISGPPSGIGCELLTVRSKDDSGAFQTGSVSVMRPGGMDWIVAELGRRAGQMAPVPNEALVTRARHRSCLSASSAWLKQAAAQDGLLPEVRAEFLRMASDEIGRITGKIGVEDLLDRIFSEFCIGK
jgi:tRNA modification GTPase